MPVQAAPAAAGPAAAQASSETNAPSALSAPLDLGSAAAPALVVQRRGLRAIFQAVVILVVATAVLVPILARNTVVQTWPEAAKVYGAVGLKTAGPGAGLDIKVTPLRSEGSFVVTGEITNTTDQPLSVPPLRVALRDPTQSEVEFQIINKAVFEHPSVTATDVVATFGPE